jgi:hypothetical protein
MVGRIDRELRVVKELSASGKLLGEFTASMLAGEKATRIRSW